MKFARANFFPLNLKERFRNARNLTTLVLFYLAFTGKDE